LLAKLPRGYGASFLPEPTLGPLSRLLCGVIGPSLFFGEVTLIASKVPDHPLLDHDETQVFVCDPEAGKPSSVDIFF
jgi:hypothetical protein